MLSAIAIAVIISFVQISRLLNVQEHYAELVNVSGRQRMLSQRIAGLAVRFAYSKDGDRTSVRNEIINLCTKLENSLRRLSASGESRQGLPENSDAAMKVILGDGTTRGADQLVRHHLELALEILTDGLDFSVAERQSTELIADKDLLDSLDRLTAQYQSDAENAMSEASKSIYAALTAVIGLIGVLFATVIVPTNRRVTRLVTNLEKSIDDARAAGAVEESSRAFLQKLAANIPGLFAYWSRDLRCKFANAEYEKWFGRRSETIIGMPMSDLLGEDLFRKNLPHIEKALEGVAQTFERTLTQADGKVAPALAQYVPDFDGRGSVQGFFVLVSDLSKLRETEKRLTERLEVAMDSAFMGAWSHDVRSGESWCSANLDKIFGFVTPPAKWTRGELLERVIPEDRPAVDSESIAGPRQLADWSILIKFKSPRPLSPALPTPMSMGNRGQSLTRPAIWSATP